MNSEVDNKNESNPEEIAIGKPSRILRKYYKKSVLGGVCLGISKFVPIDVIYVRIMFVVASLVSGWGLLIYSLLLLMMKDDSLWGNEKENNEDNRKFHSQSLFGIILSFVGLYYLLKNIGIFSFFWFFDPTSGIFLPLIFMLLGSFFFYRKAQPEVKEEESQEKLYRSMSEKRIAGVSASFSAYLNVDITIVRMVWLFSIFATLGLTLFLYIYLAVTLPYNPEEENG